MVSLALELNRAVRLFPVPMVVKADPVLYRDAARSRRQQADASAEMEAVGDWQQAIGVS